MGSTGGCIYISPHSFGDLTSLKTPVNPTILTHSLQFFTLFLLFRVASRPPPAQDCFPIPTPKAARQISPLFACCVISKPMHACPLTPTAYTSSLVFRPLHFDVHPLQKCVLTAIPTHSSVLAYRQLVHPVCTHTPAFFFFCKYHWSIFQGPTNKAFVRPRPRKVLHDAMSMSDWV